MEKFVPFVVNDKYPIDRQEDENFRSKKATLIACPWVFQGEAEFQSQQLGLAYIGAYIIQRGHKVAKYVDPMLYEGHLVREPIETEYQTIYRVGHTDEWIIQEIAADSDYIFINTMSD